MEDGGLEALWIKRGDVRDSGGSGGLGGLGGSRGSTGVVGVASALPNVMTFFFILIIFSSLDLSILFR